MRKDRGTYQRLMQKLLREISSAKVGTDEKRMKRLNKKMLKYSKKIQDLSQ